MLHCLMSPYIVRQELWLQEGAQLEALSRTPCGYWGTGPSVSLRPHAPKPVCVPEKFRLDLTCQYPKSPMF